MQKHFFSLRSTAIAGALVLCLSLLAGSGSAAQPIAEAKAEVMSCPVVTLGDWQASTRQEKLSFLLGFATMLEMEKEWQYKSPLPIGKSINSTWVKGLDGKSLGGLSDAIDKFAAEHPELKDRSVILALARMYVQPNMTKAERAEAAARWKLIQSSK